MLSPDRPYIIPVFIPHTGCPHQCVFCNQKTITGSRDSVPNAEDLHTVIHQFLSYSENRGSSVQVAFYGGNFLGIPDQQFRALLENTMPYIRAGTVQGIRFSTRPDTVTTDRLVILDGYPIQAIELGVQSMDDRVLSLSERGHTAEVTDAAVAQLRSRGYKIGLQMMVGLPGEDERSCLSSGNRIAALEPDFVRIYPTIVVKGSALARWYRQGRYAPLTLEKAVCRVKALYQLFHGKQIPVIRMGLQASEALEQEDAILAGPFHPSFGELVYSELFFEKVSEIIEDLNPTSGTLHLNVHPKQVSKLRGIKNHNINRLKHNHRFRSIRVSPDPSLSPIEIDIKVSTT